MLAGFGKNIINPPLGAELSGYGYYLERKNTGVMDNLFARCLYIEKDGRGYAAVSCDLLTLSDTVCGAVRKYALENYGIKPESLMLCATHTHTGPAVSRLEGCGELCPEYLAVLPDMICAAIRKAALNKAPVTGMQTADTAIEPVGFNRALPNGPHDNHVRGVYIRRDGASPIALVSYGCHPVTLGPKDKFSPDYPGEVCACLEEQGIEAVFFTGLCGDVDPVNNLKAWGSGTKEIIREYGERIAGAFNGALADCPTDFMADYLETDLPVLPLTPEDTEEYKGYAGNERVFAAWKKHIEDLQPASDREHIQVRIFRIGDLLFASIPYEGFTLIGDKLREAYPKAFVAGCADHTLGYLPVREDWDNGCYASIGSAILYLRQIFQKGAAETLGETLKRRVEELCV